MAFHHPHHIAEIAVETGAKKAVIPAGNALLLGFLGGAFIAIAIGFQNVVANMFVIPAAIFAGRFTWMDYFVNFVPVVIGNAIGGGLFVAFIYWFVHKKSLIQEKPGMRKAG